MNKHYITKYETLLSKVLTAHLPGSPLNIGPSAEVPKDLQDLERYPKTITYAEDACNEIRNWSYTNWQEPPSIIPYDLGVSSFKFTKHDVRMISLSIMRNLMGEESRIFTPLYKVVARYNINGEKYVDLSRNSNPPKTYESWRSLSEIEDASEMASRDLKRRLLNYTNNRYTSPSNRAELIRSDFKTYGGSNKHSLFLSRESVQILPEGIAFLFQLHLFLASILNIGTLDNNVRVRTDIWKPVPYPEEDFQLFFYNKYRLSYLRDRRTWRIWEI